MAGKLTIKLTDDQQKQIKDATGKTITELNFDVSVMSNLTDQDLDNVAGGANWVEIPSIGTRHQRRG